MDTEQNLDKSSNNFCLFQENSVNQRTKEKKRTQNINKKQEMIEKCIEDLTQCYFCLSQIREAVMCRYCHRITCNRCIKKWIKENNSCGFCRTEFKDQEDDLIKIPFMDDIIKFLSYYKEYKKKVESMDSQIKNRKKRDGKWVDIKLNDQEKENIIENEKLNEKSNIKDTNNKYQYRNKKEYPIMNRNFCFFNSELKNNQNDNFKELERGGDLFYRKFKELDDKKEDKKECIEKEEEKQIRKYNTMSNINFKNKEEDKKSEFDNKNIFQIKDDYEEIDDDLLFYDEYFDDQDIDDYNEYWDNKKFKDLKNNDENKEEKEDGNNNKKKKKKDRKRKNKQ